MHHTSKTANTLIPHPNKHLQPHTCLLQEVCEGIRTENEEQAALQQQLEQQQEQLASAEAQHSAATAQLAALRLTALHGTPEKLLEQVSFSSNLMQFPITAILTSASLMCYGNTHVITTGTILFSLTHPATILVATVYGCCSAHKGRLM